MVGDSETIGWEQDFIICKKDYRRFLHKIDNCGD